MRRPILAPLKKALAALGYEIKKKSHEGALPLDFSSEDTAVWQAVSPFTMTSPERIASLCAAIRYVIRAKVPGDIVECGVWKGGSMMAAARTLIKEGDAGRRLHLFDTFEGMTPPGAADVSIDGDSAAQLLAISPKQDLVWAHSPLEEARKAVLSTGYDPDKISFVKGRVEDTIPAQAPAKIALLRLDTDWYESTRHELVHLYPRLASGGVLIIDDYGHWKGARKAVDEYLEQNKIHLLLNRVDYTGRLALKP
ncbi:MAG: macrocin O-methyltransferase [Elusimicrobia bacterium RBG_16_66_12]|nr:MAG: macrocin O-methyltransferase [Elusimicrobia bacterium RBG_16_66_12]